VTPSISMLLPARGRPKHLKLSVESAFDLASIPDTVEFIVLLDDDDPHLREEMQILQAFSFADNIQIGIDRRLGYSLMHEYYNRSAEAAKGDWLFMWNDDIQMVSNGWDDLVRDAPLFSVQFPRRDITKTSDYTLPVIGRPIYNALGHLSMNAYCDAWISDFSAFAGTSIVRDDIVFLHHRLDDMTMAGQADGGKEWQRFTEEEQLRMRRADMEKVIAAPGYAARFNGWDIEVNYHIGVDYIKLATNELRAQGVVLKGRRT